MHVSQIVHIFLRLLGLFHLSITFSILFGLINNILFFFLLAVVNFFPALTFVFLLYLRGVDIIVFYFNDIWFQRFLWKFPEVIFSWCFLSLIWEAAEAFLIFLWLSLDWEISESFFVFFCWCFHCWLSLVWEISESFFIFFWLLLICKFVKCLFICLFKGSKVSKSVISFLNFSGIIYFLFFFTILDQFLFWINHTRFSFLLTTRFIQEIFELFINWDYRRFLWFRCILFFNWFYCV